MKIRIVNIFLLSIFLLVTSCNPIRRLAGVEEESFNLRRSLSSKLDESSYPKYILSENAALSVKGEQNINGRLTIYIEKDKSIFLMGRFLGFEAFRFELTADSVKYINRIQAEYFFESINKSKLTSQFLFSLNELQSVIYSGIWTLETNNARQLAERFVKDDSGFKLTQYIAEGQKVEMFYNASDLDLNQLILSDYVNSIMAKADFSRSVGKLTNIEADISANSIRYDVSLSLDKIENKEFKKTAFNIGKNYKRIETLF